MYFYTGDSLLSTHGGHVLSMFKHLHKEKARIALASKHTNFFHYETVNNIFLLFTFKKLLKDFKPRVFGIGLAIPHL